MGWKARSDCAYSSNKYGAAYASMASTLFPNNLNSSSTFSSSRVLNVSLEEYLKFVNLWNNALTNTLKILSSAPYLA